MKKTAARLGAVALTGALLFTGCGSMNPEATLINITNGDEKDTISLGYGNFAARYTQALYDNYYGTYLSDDMWSEDLYGSGNTMEADTKDEVLETMEEEYVCKLHAADYSIELTEEQTTAISEAAAAFMEDNSEEALEEVGATEEYVTDFLTYRTYASLVEAAVKAEAEDQVEVTDEEKNQSTISYVLLPSTTTDDDGNETALSDEEMEALKVSAAEISAASDFDAAVEAAGLTASTYSYTTTEDPADDETLDESVISAAQELSDGQVSAAILVDGKGYYVVRMDATFDEEATAEKETELHDEKVDEYYDNIIVEWEDAITWEVEDKQWEKVTFSNLFTAPATEEESSVSTEDTTTDLIAGEESTEDTSSEETTDDTSATEETEETAE